MAAGCKDADILIVDAAMLPLLEEQEGWRDIALQMMRGNEIKIIAR